ncbi:MAG: MBL fold metallo-hydrolase [Eubacterium sp.]|nr:MBL fold metallo-hydrolase [Eubacterium sp.]
MKFCTLFSGSSGNSMFVASGGTRLLVDAGLSGKRVEQALAEIDELAGQLGGILVTHEHKDHIQGVGVLSRRYDLPVYANFATWERMRGDLGKIDEKNVRVFETGTPFVIGDFRINAFRTSHDAAESVGFVIEDGRASVGIATDTGIVTEDIVGALTGRDLVVIESNHDPSMLEAGSYPFPLKQRIKGDRGHLSNEICAETVKKLVAAGLNKAVLGHLSAENNYPLLAYQTTARILEGEGMKVGEDLSLDVAARNRCGEIYEL